jgi:metallo-beta-lactamase family protein
MNAFSAHAGQDELLGYVQTMDKGKLRNIFLVHGEINQAQEFSRKLSEAGFGNISIPAKGEKTEFSR